MRRILAAALLLSACAAPAYAQSPVQEGMLEFGTKALDCTNGALALNAPSGVAGQQWAYWDDTASGGTRFLQCGTGWVAIDFSKNPLAVGAVWDNPSSANTMAFIAATPATPLEIYAMGEVLEPNAAKTSVVLTKPTAGWKWITKAPPPPPPNNPPPPPPSGSTPTPSAWVPAGYIYQASASDEFTESTLNTNVWFTRYAGSGGTQQNISSNGEQELFTEGGTHIMQAGGGVALTAYPPGSDGMYHSGMLRDRETFNFGSQSTGFYIEVKAKIPAAGVYGAWPAFWFSAEPAADGDAPWPPEIDAAEFMLQNPSLGASNASTVHMSIKTNGAAQVTSTGYGFWNGQMTGWDAANQPAGWVWAAPYGDTQWDTTVNLAADYHTYAFWITPGVAGVDPVNPTTGLPTHHYEMFIDGWEALYGNYDFQYGADGTSPYNAELLLNLAVGGVGGDAPLASAYPASFDIQYVRVYTSQNDPAALVPSTIGQNFCPASGGC